MRRLLKLIAAATVAGAAVQLLRRLLEGDQPGSAGDGASTGTTNAEVGSDGDRLTREELYREAQEIGVEGRSKMNKRQLQEAVEAAKIGGNR